MGEGCQVQVYTWALLTLGTGSRYSGSTGGDLATSDTPTSASAVLARNDFPTFAKVLHATPLSFPNMGKLLKGMNLGRRT